MADSAELAFVRKHLETIGRLPVQYGDDYLQPPNNSLKRVPIVPLDLPPPPKPNVQEEVQPAESINLIFKVTKPAHTFSLPVSYADTIASIKEKLASQNHQDIQQEGKHVRVPPAETQRLLLRGKALADTKLLKEYVVKEGDTVNLVLRPGFEWDWKADAAVSAAAGSGEGALDTSAAQSAMELDTPQRKESHTDALSAAQQNLTPSHTPAPSSKSATSTKLGHGRIPSVILSPSPSLSPLPNNESEDLAPIPLSLDTAVDAHASPASALLTPSDPYYQKLTSPEFWGRLHEFLNSEFQSPKEADEAFETFLIGSKGFLSSNDVAKIRDAIGVLGMGGM